MATTIRNIVIVLAIAALIVLIPGGGSGGTFALQAVSLVFLGVIGWFAYVSYREHKIALYSLGARRGILYAAAAVVVLTLTATNRLFNSTTGKLAWLLLLIGAAYAVFAVIWSARKY